ncbi:MAG TPA: MerR family transcriptional regulator [Vicinamibacterales bacterium]|nr:MerR family transcriptional regulator [Vicinamibacterales bacterium]
MTAIPNRPVFRAHEVCEIAQVQPYVLRSWEAEFPDLGTSKTAGGPRVYRRADVERVLRLKELVFDQGLTLAGARRQLGQERRAPEPEQTVADADVAAMLDQEMRESLRDVRRGLQWVLGVLSGGGVSPEDYVLVAEPIEPGRSARKGRTVAPRARATGGRKVAGKPQPKKAAPRKAARKRKR